VILIKICSFAEGVLMLLEQFSFQGKAATARVAHVKEINHNALLTPS
jgi:hypothetical protein